MDYLDEYLSLVQSLKAYHTPSLELNLKAPKIPAPVKESIENVSLPPMIATTEAPKKSETRIAPSSKEPLSIPSPSSEPNHPLHTTIKKALPKHIFYEYPPTGISHIKKLPSCDLPSVPIFFYGEKHGDQKFLTNLISAVQDKFGLSSAVVDTREIEDYNLWRSVTSMIHLCCVIVYDTWIATSPHGRCWYRAEPNTNNCFLGTIPLIVLSSKADWYRELHNKKVLWNQLCRILKKPSRKTILE